MNVIETKGWYALFDKMPSTEGPRIRIGGTATVSHSAIEASLALSSVQDKSLGLRLELVLEEKGIGLTVLTEQEVSLSLPGYQDTTHVIIFHNGKEMARIDKIETVY